MAELRNTIEDGRKGIPYAPYLMFMIERVSGYRFDKDGLHTVYKIEKTQGAGASRTVRCSPSVEDMLESSRSRPRKEKKMEKFRKWIKAIFTTCTYATRTTYQDRLENHKANREAREHARMPPLSPVQSPSRFDDLPSLSEIDSEEEEEQEQEEPALDPHMSLRSTLQFMRRSTRRERHTSITDHQGRTVVSSSSSDDDDDDDDGGEEDAAGASGAAGGMMSIGTPSKRMRSECWSFFFSSLFSALCQRGEIREESTTFSMSWRED